MGENLGQRPNKTTLKGNDQFLVRDPDLPKNQRVKRVDYDVVAAALGGGGGSSFSVSNTFHTVEQYAVTVGGIRIPCGTGVVRTLDSLGLSSAELAAAFPRSYAYWATTGFPIANTESTTSYDWICIQEAFLGLELGVSTHVHFTGKVYMLSGVSGKGIYVPGRDKSTSTLYSSKKFCFNGNGASLVVVTGANIFDPYVVDQAQADLDIQWAKYWENFSLIGYSANIQGVALQNHCNKGGSIKNIYARNFSCPIENRFALYNNIQGCVFFNNEMGILSSIGNWIDADYTNSISQVYIKGCEVSVIDGGRGFIFDSCDSCNVEDSVIEGPNGVTALYGIGFVNSSSTLAKNFTLRNIHEEVPCFQGLFYFEGIDSGLMHIENIYIQKSALLATINNLEGYNQFLFENIVKNDGGARWKISYQEDANTQARFRFVRTKLPSSADITVTCPNIADIVDNENIWDLTGSNKSPVLGQISEYVKL